jgi:hypothetical protein
MRKLSFICLLLIIPAFAFSQGSGFIPEELLRPGRGEAPRYPVDTVIGELGQSRASAAAYTYANTVVSALFSGRIDHPAFSSLSTSIQQNYMSALDAIGPRNYRIGGGREEADGAVSFMVRFLGREYGVTGELFIRYVTRQVQTEGEGETETVGNWVFEDLILEEAKDLESEQQESANRYDFSPYEGFF